MITLASLILNQKNKNTAVTGAYVYKQTGHHVMPEEYIANINYYLDKHNDCGSSLVNSSLPELTRDLFATQFINDIVIAAFDISLNRGAIKVKIIATDSSAEVTVEGFRLSPDVLCQNNLTLIYKVYADKKSSSCKVSKISTRAFNSSWALDKSALINSLNMVISEIGRIDYFNMIGGIAKWVVNDKEFIAMLTGCDKESVTNDCTELSALIDEGLRVVEDTPSISF